MIAFVLLCWGPPHPVHAGQVLWDTEARNLFLLKECSLGCQRNHSLQDWVLKMSEFNVKCIILKTLILPCQLACQEPRVELFNKNEGWISVAFQRGRESLWVPCTLRDVMSRCWEEQETQVFSFSCVCRMLLGFFFFLISTCMLYTRHVCLVPLEARRK